ncbi:MAG: response regulator [Mariprofundaceae bacterium]
MRISIYARYVLILVAVITTSEYAVMILFDLTGLEDSLSQEAEALFDSFLLIIISAAPIYFWVIKPVIRLSQDYQLKLKLLVEALDGAADVVIITDSNANMTYINRAFTTVTGYSQDEVIGKNPRILQSGKQSKAFYSTMWDTIITTGKWSGEVWNKRKNGELFLESLRIKSIKDDAGDVKSYIGIITDITETRQQEELLAKTQKIESIGMLVGGVAHNFNNMLAAIMGKAYLAQQMTTDPEANQHLIDIEEISNDAALIVSQLLSYSHDSIKHKEATQIVSLLKEATKTAQLGISEDIEFITNFTTEKLIVYCDQMEIQQVLMNLINNARDSLTTSLPRRISVTVESKPWEGCPRSDTCPVCNSEVAHVVIEDTGSGIDEDHLKHIFDPFFTTKGIGEGTGLGLSMTMGTVESHGGVINVSSTVGVGTKVEICLPLTDKIVEDGEQKQQPILASTDETILIIDDDEVVRSTLSQILLSLGYSVLIANNGKTGLSKFRENVEKVSLVICDIIMPVMDGIRAVEEIRKEKPELPVIFVTGYSSKKLDESIHYNELTTTVSKPFTVNELSYDVHRLLHPDAKA